MEASDDELARRCLLPLLEKIAEPTFVVRADGEVRYANASGHARRSHNPSNLERDLRDAIAGHAASGYVCTHLALNGWYLISAALARESDRAIAFARKRFRLTSRQLEVLDLVLGGATNRTVSELLGISLRTVEVHLTTIYERTGVENRASLVSLVLRSS
jgi:DNA-binding CsgD family transcriptional regulator